jgi:hypothetical protein
MRGEWKLSLHRRAAIRLSNRKNLILEQCRKGTEPLRKELHQRLQPRLYFPKPKNGEEAKLQWRFGASLRRDCGVVVDNKPLGTQPVSITV